MESGETFWVEESIVAQAGKCLCIFCRNKNTGDFFSIIEAYAKAEAKAKADAKIKEESEAKSEAEKEKKVEKEEVVASEVSKF